MSAMQKVIAAITGFCATAFLVALFWFAFTAALRPGGPDPEADAAGVAAIGALVSLIIFGAVVTFPGDDL